MPLHDQVTLVKDFTYRGKLEEWSNSYSLTGTTPTTDAGWKSLFDAIIASEKTCYQSSVRVIRAMAYKATEDHVTYSFDYLGSGATVAGTYVCPANGFYWAGDQAGWLRARVGSSSNGKPRYVRKYFHGGASASMTPDPVAGTLISAYVAHGGVMIGGTLPGSMKWCGPNGTVAATPSASPYVTTRTLKRRGRRPTPAP
jgi:hypothetical protein